MIFLFFDRSHCQESNRLPTNPILLESSTSRFLWDKEEYDCADFLEGNDDDHPETVDAGALQSIEEPIDVPAVNVIEKVAAVAKKGKKKTSAVRPKEDYKVRARCVYEERMEAKKRKSWSELKATVEAAATRDIPPHVSTTQWHFWNAVLFEIFPLLPAPERAARLLSLEARDTTDDTPEPWSEIWPTYQYVRDVDEIKTAGWDKSLRDLSENYADFSEKLDSLDSATRIALGLAVAPPPVRTEDTSMLAEPTPPEPSVPDTPVIDTGGRRHRFLSKRETTRANLGLARLAKKTLPSSDIAAPPAPPSAPAVTPIFGLPVSVPQKSLPGFGSFAFTTPASKTAGAHPTSVLAPPTPAIKFPETSKFEFGFTKSDFGASKSAYAPKLNGCAVFGAGMTPEASQFNFSAPKSTHMPVSNEGAVFGTGMTPQTPKSSSTEQAPKPAVPTGRDAESTMDVFNAPPACPGAPSADMKPSTPTKLSEFSEVTYTPNDAAIKNIFAHLIAQPTSDPDTDESDDDSEVEESTGAESEDQEGRAPIDEASGRYDEQDPEEFSNVDEESNLTEAELSDSEVDERTDAEVEAEAELQSQELGPSNTIVVGDTASLSSSSLDEAEESSDGGEASEDGLQVHDTPHIDVAPVAPIYTAEQFAIQYVSTHNRYLTREDMAGKVLDVLNALSLRGSDVISSAYEDDLQWAPATYEEALVHLGPCLLGLSTVTDTEGAPRADGLSVEYLEEDEATTTASSAPIMVVVTAPQAMYDDDHSSSYVNGYERLCQFDCDNRGSQDDDDVDNDQLDGVDQTTMANKQTPKTEEELGSSDHDEELLDSDFASGVTRTPSLTHTPDSVSELAIDSGMAEDYMLDGYGRPLELTGVPGNDDKFFEAVHTKIVSESDQYEFDGDGFCYLGDLLAKDEEADNDVAAIDNSSKAIQLVLDMESLEDNWAQEVLSQVFPEFEEAEAKLSDVAPQHQLELDQTSFLYMFEIEGLSKSSKIPDDTSLVAAKLRDVQLDDDSTSSIGSIFVNCVRLLHEMEPYAAVVDTGAQTEKADHLPDHPATRKVTFQPAPTKEWHPKRGTEAVFSTIFGPSTISPPHGQGYRPSHSNMHTQRSTRPCLDTKLTGIGTNELGKPAPFNVSER